MAGIYLHIPFCKKACSYCNFHFSTSLKLKNDLIQSLLCEVEQKRHYAQPDPIETIYFGGGTPSLLTTFEIKTILDAIYKNFTVNQHAEITLEANPDNLNSEYLHQIREVGINRLSIGIQSFYEEDLEFMQRSHNAEQALQCIQEASAAGFNNLSMDLIFGFPLLTDSKWANNVQRALQLPVTHISCYAMTVEPKTLLQHQIDHQKVKPISSEQGARQYEYLMQQLIQHGYEHYEISNFALPGYRAVHNSNYWNGNKYIGLGPSAHSYNGQERQWNIANNSLYLKGIQEALPYFEKEVLSRTDQINETIMIQLRRIEGLNLASLQKLTTVSEFDEIVLSLQPFKDQGWVIQTTDGIELTPSGKLMADHIASSLFL